MGKPGRNELCPCGSGKKFKRCHGDLSAPPRETQDLAWFARNMKARAEAAEFQRVRQQGRGAPIISAESHGVRLVAVKNRFLQSDKWKTFHDFLMAYIKIALGPAWGNAEIAKAAEERHPIITWYQLTCELQQKTIVEPGKVSSGKMNGATAAYLHLAYDLYALDHNAELQDRLLARLRDHDNFHGARYEIQVAAMLIRGGFSLQFENESDGSTTHCEFTATAPGSGKQFSVEAKRSDAGPGRLMRQLHRALSKNAKYERVVFIDINIADAGTDGKEPVFMKAAQRRIRRYEETDPAGQKMPRAYLFVTNTPWLHHLDQEQMRMSVLGEGFHIPEFKEGTRYASIGEAVAARDAHVEMFSFLDSIREHAEIPSTFDGQLPDFAFGIKTNRLLIGERYTVPDGSETFRDGILMSATVNEKERLAYGVMRLDDGRQIITTFALTDAELEAWRGNPDTFFGVMEKGGKKIAHPVELYDWLMNTYKNSTKDKLLEFLKSAPDFDVLKGLPQEQLAKIYVERMAAAMLTRARFGKDT